MQERRVQTDAEINSDLLNNVLKARRWYWPLVGFLATVVLAAIIAWSYVIIKGLGVTGLNRPVYWGFFVTNFVFWIGISHAGVMLFGDSASEQGGVETPGDTSGGGAHGLLADDRRVQHLHAYRSRLAVCSTGRCRMTLRGGSGPTCARPSFGTPAPSPRT